MRPKAGPSPAAQRNSAGASQPGAPSASFRGNKAALPSKPCQACGRPMTWRRHWAKNWDAVKYCCSLCRQTGGSRG